MFMDGSNVWNDESTQQLKIPDLTNQIGIPRCVRMPNQRPRMATADPLMGASDRCPLQDVHAVLHLQVRRRSFRAFNSVLVT